MANENSNLGQFIQDQMRSLRDDVRSVVGDLKTDVRSNINDLKDDIKEVRDTSKSIQEDVENIKDELGGQDGIRERLTAIEVRYESMHRSLAGYSQAQSTYPPPPSKKNKRTLKENAGLIVGGTAGAGGILYAAIELVNNLIKAK